MLTLLYWKKICSANCVISQAQGMCAGGGVGGGGGSELHMLNPAYRLAHASQHVPWSGRKAFKLSYVDSRGNLLRISQNRWLLLPSLPLHRLPVSEFNNSMHLMRVRLWTVVQHQHRWQMSYANIHKVTEASSRYTSTSLQGWI